MDDSIFAGFERLARSLAYDLTCRRDGRGGWKARRDEFRRSFAKDERTLRQDIEKKLGDIVSHAFYTVPYYRDVWKASGLDPAEFARCPVLAHIPCITKEIVRDYRPTLVSSLYPEDMLDVDRTSGTSGPHTVFYRDHECTLTRVGRHWGVLERCGYRPGMKRALVWGVDADLPATGVKQNLKSRFRSFARSQLALPCRVMTESDMSQFYEKLVRFRPDVLYGYPGAIEELGRFISESNLPPVKFKSIITTAERLTTGQRRFFQEVFAGEVFNLYATREYGCVGFECPAHDGFHIDAESVVVEITRDGRPLPAGEAGEVTITDLVNRAMPFIRSRTGDIGLLSPDRCVCGSSWPVLQSLQGRNTDVLYRVDGSPVAGILLPDLFVDIPGVRGAQFVQSVLGEVEVVLAVNDDYGWELEQEGLRQFQTVMGEGTKVQVRHVQNIPRNVQSGKHQDVICRVPAEELRVLRDRIRATRSGMG